MTKPRTTAPFFAVLALSACAASGPPPVPPLDAPAARAANSAAVLAQLRAAQRAAAAQPDRAEIEERRRARYYAALRESPRQWLRPPSPDAHAHLPGNAEPIDRTVVVHFPFGSAHMAPEPSERPRILQLLATADRVIVRGRTDAIGNRDANQRMAKRRAEAARIWLVERGFPADQITVNATSGDFVAANDHDNQRQRNRRVEIEFVYDDPRLTAAGVGS